MISLIIPTNKTNSNYTKNLVNNIRSIYPDETQVEIIVSEDDTVTMGVNYNNAVARAKGEKIILLHNDMVIKPGFVEQMDKDIVKGRITAYTRVEPPIYPDTYAGKIILDCGTSLETFNEDKFLNFNIEDTTLLDGGAQMFFGCMKEDYLGIDGYTFKLFCEDDDLHLRHNVAGYEQKVSSAHVYHFISKTSRVGNYQDVEMESNKKFVKKWGFRKSEYNVVYNKKCIVKNCNDDLKEALSLWFNEGEDIIVEIDGNTFTSQDYTYIQQLNDIIKNNNELGEFELGNLKIKVNSLEEHQHKLIKL
jgi:cellulose synthase/poly-beta-1,6-N-acetylglucosamine synthase-like glycosyltransferase